MKDLNVCMMFEEYMTLSVPDITPAAMQKAKDTKFSDSLLRVETHGVDDVSDYDIAPVNHPNDEYVSDGDVEADRDSNDGSE
ncbi:hypothetical protein HID58_054938 [Brassica napus]|uniref:Uncharacterized protein n=1 Tax=Brassica napus TaxID=3708 RepID=A0ABQ8AIV3_BRANA|nr:hypothetical protein HID58_054938 [Brassica napus]